MHFRPFFDTNSSALFTAAIASSSRLVNCFFFRFCNIKNINCYWFCYFFLFSWSLFTWFLCICLIWVDLFLSLYLLKRLKMEMAERKDSRMRLNWNEDEVNHVSVMWGSTVIFNGQRSQTVKVVFCKQLYYIR